MVQDFLGNEIEPGDYFAYPLTIGRSCQMAVFKYVGATPKGSHKALPITRSYDGWREENKYKVFEWEDGKGGWWRDMTPAERAKVDAKTSTLHYLDKRAVKIKYKE